MSSLQPVHLHLHLHLTSIFIFNIYIYDMNCFQIVSELSQQQKKRKKEKSIHCLHLVIHRLYLASWSKTS